jgi:hypothetical protein
VRACVQRKEKGSGKKGSSMNKTTSVRLIGGGRGEEGVVTGAVESFLEEERAYIGCHAASRCTRCVEWTAALHITRYMVRAKSWMRRLHEEGCNGHIARNSTQRDTERGACTVKIGETVCLTQRKRGAGRGRCAPLVLPPLLHRPAQRCRPPSFFPSQGSPQTSVRQGQRQQGEA